MLVDIFLCVSLFQPAVIFLSALASYVFSQTCNLTKMFWFLTPIMLFLPKKHRHTHTEQHDYLLICFLIVLSIETEKMQQTLLCVVLFRSIRVLGACWVYYKIGILKLITHIGFGFFKLFWVHQCQFFVYKLGPR